MQRKHFYTAAALFILFLSSWFLLRPVPDRGMRQLEDLKANPRPIRTIDRDALASIEYAYNPEGGKRIVSPLTFDQKVALLREKWGKIIQSNYAQIKMLEELIRYCQKEQPDDWVGCANEMSAAAFPDLAPQLFANLDALVRYNAWLSENRDDLKDMSRAERQKLLKDKRISLFGENAAEIWAPEEQAENVRASLAEISKSSDLPLSAKLNHFTSTLRETYGKSAPTYIENHKQELVHSFLDVVQTDLQNMNPVDQKTALREIRSAMGMDKAAIERWDVLDTERDQRWDKGKTYMQELEKLQKESDSADKIVELRKRYFGEEAESIAIEEAEGYFRFNQTRRIGIE
ncbi:MAG: hypothetical protein KDK41_04350 [Leptospiraceae bacterium]|nr:hypothetical protein [Leptospiraceae bacterium]